MDPHEIAKVDQIAAAVNDSASDIFQAILLRAAALWEYDAEHEAQMNETISSLIYGLYRTPEIMSYVMLAGFRTAMEALCVQHDMSPMQLLHEMSDHNENFLIELKAKFDEMRFTERKNYCGADAHVASGTGWPGV
jgi:hypothetical protein